MKKLNVCVCVFVCARVWQLCVWQCEWGGDSLGRDPLMSCESLKTHTREFDSVFPPVFINYSPGLIRVDRDANEKSVGIHIAVSICTHEHVCVCLCVKH